MRGGANLKSTNLYGQTPLHLAAMYSKDVSVIRLMLERGADIEALDDYAFEPLHLAAAYNAEPAITKALLDGGSDVNTQIRSNAVTFFPDVDDMHSDPVHFIAVRPRRLIMANRAAVFDRRFDDMNPYPIPHPTPRAEPDPMYFINISPLHLAAANNNPAVVNLLLDEGADINARTGNFFYQEMTPLHIAAAYNEVAVIRALLNFDGRPTLTVGDEAYQSLPLHYAAMLNQSPETVVFLIESATDIDVRNVDGQTPLFLAAKHNPEPSVLEALLERGADPYAYGENEMSALHRAAEYNKNPAVVELLLKHGLEINDVRDHPMLGRQSPLTLAVLNSAAVTELLLNNGAEINDRETSIPPLDQSMEWGGNFEITKLLLERGADVNIPTDRTTLQQALMQMDLPIIELLLDYGADTGNWGDQFPKPSICEYLEWSPGAIYNTTTHYRLCPEHKPLRNADPRCGMLCAWRFWAHATLDDVRTLLNRGEGAYLHDGSRLALHHAAKRVKDPAIIQLLLDQGIDVNLRTASGATPLHYAAATNEEPAIAASLLDNGADIDVFRVKAWVRDGNTPLHDAVQQERLAVAELLLKRGADIHALSPINDIENSTLLHISTRLNSGKPTMARLLLNYGADVNIEADRRARNYAPTIAVDTETSTTTVPTRLKRITPLQDAIQRMNPLIVKLLLERGADADIDTLLFAINEGPHPYTIKALLDHTDVDINARYENGNTLLHLVAQKFGFRSVKELNSEFFPKDAIELLNMLLDVLLDRDPDLSLRNDSGKTPCEYTSYHRFCPE